MGYADALSRDARRVLLTQALLTLLLAGGFWLMLGLREALAALYGGAVTILVTGWLARRIRRAGRTPSPGAGLIVIYSGVVVRYAAVIVLLGAGFGLLDLPPLPLLSAFAVTQFGFLVSMLAPGGATRPGR